MVGSEAVRQLAYRAVQIEPIASSSAVWRLTGSVAHLQLLRFPGEFAEDGIPLAVDLRLVVHDVFHADTAAPAGLAVRQDVVLEEFDEERKRDVSHVRGLHAGQFRAFRYQHYATASHHCFQ